MLDGEAIILLGAFGTIGGALGARITNAAPWKGAVVYLVSAIITATLFTLLAVDSIWLSILCNLVLAGIMGGAMGLRPYQTYKVITGSVLLTVLAAIVAAAIAGPR